MLQRVLIIIALGFLAYVLMLQAPFKTMDDRVSIVENPLIKSTANTLKIFQQGYFQDQSYYRPLVNLSFMGEYHAFGLTPFFYNLDNLILHILNALLVFLLVSKLCKDDTTGFWAALLFVIHPIQWEAVCNISGRAILMSAFFDLSTFILFLKFYESRRWFYQPLMFITFFAGLLCKESSGVIPAVLIAYLCLDKSVAWTKKVLCIWPFFIAVALYYFVRHSVGITQIYQAGNTEELFLGFVTFLRSVMTDLRLFVLPIDLHFDRCLPFFLSFFYPPAILAISFWALVLLAIVLLRQKITPFYFFLMGWFAIELFPVSQLVSGVGVGSGYISTAEHFLYLASVPVFIGMVMAYRGLCELNTKSPFVSPSLFKWVAGCFFVFLFLTTVEQSIYAANEFTMISRSLSFEPHNPRLQNAFGLLSVARSDIPDAEKHFRLAIQAEPMKASYHISLGSALCQEGRWIEALVQFVVFDPGKHKNLVKPQEDLCMTHIRQELAQGKTFGAREWLAIGIYYSQRSQTAQAIEAFIKSASVDPNLSDAWYNLASLYLAEHNWQQARMACKKLLSLHNIPDFQKDFASQHVMNMGS